MARRTPEELQAAIVSWTIRQRPVPRLYARKALLEAGLWDSLPALINAMPSPQKEYALAYFEDARTWKRDDSTLLGMAAALGLTDAQIDALFVRAHEIEDDELV